jgi:hypothetical protein
LIAVKLLSKSLTVVASLVAAQALAASRPLVEVRFDLNEPVYRAQFNSQTNLANGTSELQQFQTGVARKLETLLGQRLGFLQFGPATNAYRLLVSIEREPTANPLEQLVHTHFSLRLSDPSSPRLLGQLQWEFRPVQEYINSVVPETFLEEITNRLSVKLDQDLPTAMTLLFSQIPVAEEVYIVIDPAAVLCVLPFSFSEIEADRETGFEFETQKQQGPMRVVLHHGASAIAQSDAVLTNLPSPYLTGIVAQEDAARVRLDQSHSNQHFPHTKFGELGTTSGPIKGPGVFVTYYVHLLPTVSGTNLPSGFLFQ